MGEVAKEEYRRVSFAPAVSHAIRLDFETKDAGGEVVTPECAFKEKKLLSMCHGTATAIAKARKQEYIVVGTAGVGKTTTQQWLAGDESGDTKSVIYIYRHDTKSIDFFDTYLFA